MNIQTHNSNLHVQRPGVYLIKTFGVNLLTFFCKLVHFIEFTIFVALLRKDLAYKKEGVNLRQKVL
jgi:hypothetical protein